jgi:hypothetical protein
VSPPGGAATTTRTGREGNVSAVADVALLYNAMADVSAASSKARMFEKRLASIFFLRRAALSVFGRRMLAPLPMPGTLVHSMPRAGHG